MYSIGIIARPGRELTRIRAELSPKGQFNISTYTDAPNAVSVLKSRKLSGLVVVVEEFGLKQINLIEKIRYFQPGLPIVFMATYLDFTAQQQAIKIPGIIALSSLIEVNNLPGVIHRMIQGYRVRNRSDRRQQTLQAASIFDLNQELLDSGCLLDLAGSGARIRSFKNQYNVGDQLKVKIPLTFLRKTYEVEAQIVWSQKEPKTETHPTESILLGVRFLSVLG